MSKRERDEHVEAGVAKVVEKLGKTQLKLEEASRRLTSLQEHVNDRDEAYINAATELEKLRVRVAELEEQISVAKTWGKAIREENRWLRERFGQDSIKLRHYDRTIADLRVQLELSPDQRDISNADLVHFMNFKRKNNNP